MTADAPRTHPVEVLSAIITLRAYLRDAFICDGCDEAPMFGCASCQTATLDRQLQALANWVDADCGPTLPDAGTGG